MAADDNQERQGFNELLAELTDSDVRSLYRYLRSLPPVATTAGPSHRPVGWKPDR